MAKNTRNSYGFGKGGPLPKMVPLPIAGNRAPLNSDVGYEIGTDWIYENNVWKLTSLQGGIANWEPISQSAGGNAPLSKYVVDANGTADYITIQSALDAAQAEIDSGAVTAAAVYVRPGVYTENLTCYGKVDLLATQSQTDSYITEIIGTHTPPLTGYSGWYGFTLTGETAVWRSNAAGTARLGQWNIITRLTGDGYTYDIPNWAGEVNLWGFLDDITIGNVNGWINNEFGSAEVNIIFAGVGLTPTTGQMLINGSLVFQGMLIGTKVKLLGNATGIINMGCELLNTIELTGNSSIDIANSYFFTGTEAAIIHNSTGTVNLQEVGINSTNATPIQGTGAGNISLSGVSFAQSSNIAGTLTLDTTPKIKNSGIGIVEGTNATSGIATLVGGTVTVNTTAVTANSRIQLTHQTNSGTPDFVSVTARVVGTSFTITSANAADTSDIAWLIIEPA